MSSELGVSFQPRQSTARVPPPNIGDLPQELCNQIFRDVSPLNLQAAACVSRSMNGIVIAAAHFHEFHFLRNFIKSLMQKLPEQKELLAKIGQNITSQNFANLLLLKRSILDVKKQLIDVIKTVDEETTKGLHHDVRPPHFLEDIFTLAAIERQIDEAHLIPDENERGEALGDISKDLVRAGNIDRAIAVATSISSESMRENALGDISRVLAQAGDIERALAVATSISNEIERWDMLKTISLTLLRAGDIDRSLAVAWSIPNQGMRGYALRDISGALARAGDRDRGLEVATSIADEYFRGQALWDISRALKEAGDRDKAVEVATSIADEYVRGYALRDIFSLQ